MSLDITGHEMIIHGQYRVYSVLNVAFSPVDVSININLHAKLALKYGFISPVSPSVSTCTLLQKALDYYRVERSLYDIGVCFIID